MLQITQSDLAKRAGITPATLNAIERGGDALASTLANVRAALANEGVVFGADARSASFPKRKSFGKKRAASRLSS